MQTFQMSSSGFRLKDWLQRTEAPCTSMVSVCRMRKTTLHQITLLAKAPLPLWICVDLAEEQG